METTGATLVEDITTGYSQAFGEKVEVEDESVSVEVGYVDKRADCYVCMDRGYVYEEGEEATCVCQID